MGLFGSASTSERSVVHNGGRASVAQLAELPPCKRTVSGSNPLGGSGAVRRPCGRRGIPSGLVLVDNGRVRDTRRAMQRADGVRRRDSMMNIRRMTSLALAGCLVAASTVALTGCTADSRIAAIDQALNQAAADASPYLLGFQSGDIAGVLKASGNASTIMVPVLIADVGASDATVTASSTSPGGYSSVATAANELAGAGETAWREWFTANERTAEYVTTDIPVTISGDKELTVAVDTDALKMFVEPFATANVTLFVKASEALPQWQELMVTEHAEDFIPTVTGLSKEAAGEAKLDKVEPGSDGAFNVTLSYPDPKAVVEYQVEQAQKSYGTGKIWGDIPRSEFEANRDKVTDIPSSLPVLTSDAVVKVTADPNGDYSADASLSDNLARQADRYHAEAQPGLFTPPAGIEEAKKKATDDAMSALAKQVIKVQPRPGTKRLVGGTSGMSVTINTGNTGDKHVTFFKWGTSTQVVSCFIMSGKSLTVRVPVGSYRLVYAIGENWYGNNYSFGPDGYYGEFKKSATDSSPMKMDIQNNYNYTLSLGTTSGSGGGVPAGSTDNPFEK